MKLIIPLLIIALLGGMFFVHADQILDENAKVVIENNRVYLKVFEDNVLLDRYLLDYEYNIEFLEKAYVVTAYSPVLGGTGSHYKVYIVDRHGKVWHDNELMFETDLEDNLLHIEAEKESITFTIESLIEKLKEEGAHHKIECMRANEISLSDVVGFYHNQSNLYLSYEILCHEAGLDLGYITVCLNEKAQVQAIKQIDIEDM